MSSVLKDIIAQPRPQPQLYLDEYGMPSSHTVFAFYFGFMILFQIISIPKDQMHILFKLFYIAVVIFLTCFVGFARVYLEYHSVPQVLAGGIIGIISAAIVFTLSKLPFMKYCFEQLCGSWIGRFLLLRNYSDVGYATLQDYKLDIISGKKK